MNNPSLDFGVNDIDSHTQDLSTIPPTQEDNKEIHRYDAITDIQDKRKQVIYDIKKGTLNPKDYPLIFKKFGELLDMTSDGRYVYRIPPTSDKSKENYYLSLRTKLITFISTGKLGDALASTGSGEIQRIAKDIAEEIMRYIPLSDDHPTRKLLSLYRNGTLQDIVDFNLKKKHYDIFDKSWYDNSVKPMVMRLISNYRKTDKNELRGNFKESFNLIKERLKKVYEA